MKGEGEKREAYFLDCSEVGEKELKKKDALESSKGRLPFVRPSGPGPENSPPIVFRSLAGGKKKGRFAPSPDTGSEHPEEARPVTSPIGGRICLEQ